MKKEAAIARTHSQLQEQQERYTKLSHKAEAESNEAAAAAATQMEQSEKMAEQLRAQVGAAQLRGDRLQSSCDAQDQSFKDVTAELASSKACAETLQVSFMAHLCQMPSGLQGPVY